MLPGADVTVQAQPFEPCHRATPAPGKRAPHRIPQWMIEVFR